VSYNIVFALAIGFLNSIGIFDYEIVLDFFC